MMESSDGWSGGLSGVKMRIHRGSREAEASYHDGMEESPGASTAATLLLGLSTAHLRTAEGLKKQTHPGLSVFEFRPYISVSSRAAVLCAELYLPSKTPNKKTFRLVCWGKCPPCCCRGGVPMEWFLASRSQHPLPFRSSPRP